ncbi:radical SAM protein [Candidatus Woesearchaeota archaeon]|jgi:MoaA/NifB/PqqE/SkfB family radical SAM enzyme|nr:radical SAM protein [Candidatus Woesearchaeota archaeon]MBT6044820.1 radical SAM protein [Candidatus Woesearchaeota archaeon]
MKVLKKPDPGNIGKYFLFVEGLEEDSLESFFGEGNISKVFLHDNSKSPKGIPLEVELLKIPIDEFEERKQRVLIPNWVRNVPNLERVVGGDFQGIRPVTAEFVTTLNCNFRCSQCSYTVPKEMEEVWMDQSTGSDSLVFQHRNSDRTHMSHKTMEIALDRLAEGGVKNILFTGGGEPLRNKRVTLEGMKRAKRNGNIVALYTNGRLMGEDTAKELAEIDPLFVRVSIYGGDQESFQAYTRAERDKEGFESVLRNINNLAKLKLQGEREMVVGLSFLVHPLTADSATSFAREISELDSIEGIDYVRFTPAVEYFGETQHNQRFMEDAFKKIREEGSPYLEAVGVESKLYNHRLRDLNSQKSYDSCLASGWFIEVGPSGEVFLCCEKHFLEDYKIGDLRTQTVDEIWQGDLRNRIIGNVNSSGCVECPTLCKPHELNKLFYRVSQMTDEERQKIFIPWMRDLSNLEPTGDYCPGKLDDFQS